MDGFCLGVFSEHKVRGAGVKLEDIPRKLGEAAVYHADVFLSRRKIGLIWDRGSALHGEGKEYTTAGCMPSPVELF